MRYMKGETQLYLEGKRLKLKEFKEKLTRLWNV